MLANPITMHPHNRDSAQFPERHVAALEAIIDDPCRLLTQSAAKIAGPTTELDILSASRYPYGLIPGYDSDNSRPKRKVAPTTDPSQYYGGIVFRASPSSKSHDNDSSSAEPEAPPERPKKRPKKSKNAEDDANDDPSKKQRGRPRLDTQDENAADRRRTQIRLAQRAYRHRKETTIVALKQRVGELQGTIEKMNTTFLTLHDNLVDAGIANRHNFLASQLQAASDEFITLSKVTDEDYEDEETQKIAEMTGNEKGSRPSQFSNEPLQSGSQKQSQSSQATPQLSLSDDADIEELPSTHPYAYMNTDGWVGMQQDLMQFNVQVPEATMSVEQLYSKQSQSSALTNPPTLEKPLSSPGNFGFYTYSFQETTFARRLHRMTMERAFRNLTNPSIDPEYLKRAFRFTFCFSNRKRMLHRFQQMLKRKAGESLENWNVPFFHIGGAGTHYPRRDQDGKPIYPPNMLAPEKAFGDQFGPRAWIEVETPREGSTQEILESIGFGGQWFDPHDVEEYLKTKGIYIDGQSSFIEIDPSTIKLTVPSLIHNTSSSESSSITGGQSPMRTPSPIFGNGGLQAAQDMYTQTHFDDFNMFENLLMEGNNPNFSDKSAEAIYNKQIWPWKDTPAFPFDSNFSSAADQVPVADQMSDYADLLARKSQPLTFDVEKFLERMIDGSACLGRAPGYRREVVDNALAMSLAEAF